MTLSARLFVYFTVLLTLGMLLLASVVFDSFKQVTLRKDLAYVIASNDNLAQFLSLQASRQDSAGVLLDSLEAFNSEEFFVMVIDASGVVYSSGKGESWKSEAAGAQLLTSITSSETQGHLYTDTMTYVWAKTLIPGSRHAVVTLHQESDSSMQVFIRDFGLPLLITGLLMLWIAVWVSLILGALFKKLDKQKHKLEEQAATIAEARDKALRANKAKSTFLANMSHEIRTPLTAIIGYSDALLGNGQIKQDQFDAINTIHKSSQHVLHIINEILDLSKIEAEKLEIEKMMVSPVQILKDVSALMRMQANEKDLLFQVNYKTPVPETILTDPTRLKQILLNLFSNAVKFTSQGSVSIDVSCRADKQLMRFDIIDTGIGMNKEQMDRIFDAFSQADASTTRKYGGTGLGLTLSRQLAEMLGGAITVESEPGKGSRFMVEITTGKLDNIPFVDQVDDMASADNNSRVVMPQKLLCGNVLIVEDTEVNQKLLEIYARKLGAEVTIAENGMQAIEYVRANDYDLVLMDMQMPVMNGVDATRALRKLGYTRPIVALTANASNEDREQCLSAGCDDFMVKPVDRDRFDQVVSGYLRAPTQQPEAAPVISTLLEENPDIADLVEAYIEGLPSTVSSIRQAVAKADWDTLENMLHQLKGSAGNYGYPELSKLATSLESHVIDRDEHEVDQLTGTIEAYCERIYAGKQAVIEGVISADT
ncbi:MAG: ATP-binding protein [Granulosicoccaceae bacterium]|jgi:signal transduction histidine kinase/CheY-like chemotaxis protein